MWSFSSRAEKGRLIVSEGATDGVPDGGSGQEPPCQHFGQCGGCQLQHLTPPQELAHKRALWEAAMTAHGLIPETLEPPQQMAAPGRRRASLHLRFRPEGPQLGFFARRSKALVEIDQCPALTPALQAFLERMKSEVLSLSAFLAPEGSLHVTDTQAGIDLVLTRAAATSDLPGTELVKLAALFRPLMEPLGLARVSFGTEVVIEAKPVQLNFGTLTVDLPPGAFLQPSAAGEAALVRQLLAFAEANPRRRPRKIIDLFAGVGTFSVPLSELAPVQAFEGAPAPVAALKRAAHARVKPITPEARDLFRRPLLAGEMKEADLVVLNPPRQGAEAQARHLAKADVPRILYVSCRPESFSRDAKVLVAGGYRFSRLALVDQFRWSDHIEGIAQFDRPKPKGGPRGKRL